MIPLQPGQFSVTVQAVGFSDTVSIQRKVYVPPFFLENTRSSLIIDTSFFEILEDMEIRQGERLTFFIKGTPGARADFSVAGIVQHVRMDELNPRRNHSWEGSVFKQGEPPFLPKIRGIYAGTYKIAEDAPTGKSSIHFTLSTVSGDTVSAFSKTALWVRKKDFQRNALVKYTTEVTDESGEAPISVNFATGTEVLVIGRSGKFYRAALSKTKDAWIPADRLFFSTKFGNQLAGKIVDTSVHSQSEKVEFRIVLNKRLPFVILQNADSQALTLVFYGAILDSMLDKVVSTNDVYNKIQWQQKENGELHGTFALDFKQQWGYRTFYEDSTLVVEIKRPLEIRKKRESKYQDLVICLDAGHSPDAGAIGPTGAKEKDVSSRYILQLKNMLESRGTKVVLTRGAHTGSNLSSRALFANLADADLFISLHFNALPDGLSPFRSRGTSTYYFHRHSFAFAEAIHKRLLQKTRLRNFGLHENDLAVCRITSIPAILLEPAFLMIPSEEIRILDPDFQTNVCEAIVQGIEDFLRYTVK